MKILISISIVSDWIQFNILVTLFIFSVVLTSACAPKVVITKTGKTPESVVELPFVQAKTGHIILNLFINKGESKNFIVDTGAMANVVTNKTAQEQGMQEGERKRVITVGWGGKLKMARLIDLENVEIGPLVYRDLSAVVKEMPSNAKKTGMAIHGILGRPFFLLHDVEIDLPAKVLRLHTKGTFASMKRFREPLMHSFSFSGYKGNPLVRLTTSDDTALFLLVDTGCGKSILNTKAAQLFHADWENAEVLSMRVSQGIEGKPVRCRTYRFDSFKVGDLFRTPVPLEVCELPLTRMIEVVTGESEAPIIVLGNDLLADRILLFDADGEKVFISNPVSN